MKNDCWPPTRELPRGGGGLGKSLVEDVLE